jgi:Zn-dependent protease with chaperone function
VQELRGRLHDGATSRSREASLRFYADGSVRLVCGDREERLELGALRVPARLGNTPRRIALADGSEFETDDNDGVDAVLDRHGPRRHGWLHRMESRVAAVLLATVLVLVAGGVFVAYGIPALSRVAAFALSPETNEMLAEGTLEVLDRSFRPSRLSEQRQAELRVLFDELVDTLAVTPAPELLLRAGGPLRANAFALPDGTVILTDELVSLSEDDRELVGVMAHELGHVAQRHGLRQAIQSSALALGIVLVTGDLSATSGAVAALPALLAEARYSRAFEEEADAYALDYLLRSGVDPEHLAALLERLERSDGGTVDVPFLGSHPATRERVERLREAGRQQSSSSRARASFRRAVSKPAVNPS